MTKIGEVFRSDYVTVFRNGCSESVAMKGAVQWRAICGGMLTEWRGSREVAENEARAFVGLPQVEQYRPFKDAAEFMPYRHRWWRYKEMGTPTYLRRPPVAYSDIAHDGVTWQKRFDECEFEDGTPFGVRVS